MILRIHFFFIASYPFLWNTFIFEMHVCKIGGRVHMKKEESEGTVFSSMVIHSFIYSFQNILWRKDINAY